MLCGGSKPISERTASLPPREINREDGRRYEIDRITDIWQAAAIKVGGQRDRYTVMISGHQFQLFLERSTAIAGNNIRRRFVERQ